MARVTKSGAAHDARMAMAMSGLAVKFGEHIKDAIADAIQEEADSLRKQMGGMVKISLTVHVSPALVEDPKALGEFLARTALRALKD